MSEKQPAEISPSIIAEPETLGYATPASPTPTITNDSDVIEQDGVAASSSKKGSSPSPSTPIPDDSQPSKEGGSKGEHWLEKTELVLPKNNLYVVFTGLMLTVFL